MEIALFDLPYSIAEFMFEFLFVFNEFGMVVPIVCIPDLINPLLSNWFLVCCYSQGASAPRNQRIVFSNVPSNPKIAEKNSSIQKTTRNINAFSSISIFMDAVSRNFYGVFFVFVFFRSPTETTKGNIIEPVDLFSALGTIPNCLSDSIQGHFNFHVSRFYRV